MKTHITLTLEEARECLEAYHKRQAPWYEDVVVTIQVPTKSPQQLSQAQCFRMPNRHQLLQAMGKVYDFRGDVPVEKKIEHIRILKDIFISEFNWYLPLGYAKGVIENWKQVCDYVYEKSCMPADCNGYFIAG